MRVHEPFGFISLP